MKKRKLTKLSLNRETLRRLQERHLGRVQGGETGNTYCLTNCPWCPPSETTPECGCSFTCWPPYC